MTTNQDCPKCQFCGNDTVEELDENHFCCKTCGVGFKKGLEGSPDLNNYLKFLKSAVMMAKILNPQMNSKDLAKFIQTHLHNVEKHPLDKHGFCGYCNISYKKEKQSL